MSRPEGQRSKSLTAVVAKGVAWLLKGVAFFFCFVLLAWGTLATYYSNLPWGWGRVALAVAFGAFGVWALWVKRSARSRLAFAGAFVAVAAWYLSIRPSHDRAWRGEVAVMPRAETNGDVVRLTGVRDFEYRSRTDFTPRYEEREVLVSHLTSVDLFVSYWKPGPVAHTFVSFIFDNAPPVCVSIETRPEDGEGYDPIASLFKQYELIYVVGDERDLVGVRANHRVEDVYLYHIQASPEFARRLFLVYLERINELADRAEFYHLLKNSCTVNIVRYANVAGRVGWFDIGHLFNGLIDRYLYRAGLLDITLPFEEFRSLSRINGVVPQNERDENFSEQIRASLP